MRLISLLVVLLPFSVFAKTVHVDFNYTMPKGVNSLKYDFIFKNEARKQALRKIDAGIFVGKRTLIDGELSEYITKITPLVLRVNNLRFAQDINNNFRVQADVNYQYDDLKQLADSLSGLDKLKVDNVALKNAISEIEAKYLSLRYQRIHHKKNKIFITSNAKTKGKEAVFYIDTTDSLNFVNYTDEELKDIARYYADIVQNYFISEISYITPKVQIADNIENKSKDEISINIKWGFDIDLQKFKNKYNDYFIVKGAVTNVYQEKQTKIKSLLGSALKTERVYPWHYEPYKSRNNSHDLNVFQIEPKLAYASNYTLNRLKQYFDIRMKNQIVRLSNVLNTQNKNKHIVRYVFAILDNYYIFNYRASISVKEPMYQAIPDYKKWTIKSFKTPFSEMMGASWGVFY